MNDIAIRVEKLSKQYKIGAIQQRRYTIRDAIAKAMYAPFQAMASLLNGRRSSVPGHPSSPSAERLAPSNIIWALKDVSFEVKHGEVIGIIGRNGAGKSTLLKILSRITEPTEGRAEIYGRVGSLLEVGMGFHMELTGRENIYLNGAILGMKKAEIDHKFDEIVAFAELERFIDTPVKRYSSGMYVRLAFAVAAHLEPEILIVDEVLAVGDIAFQKKCLSKIDGVAREGRTVLFVSHNMATIQALCQRLLLLQDGTVKMNGEPHVVISHYLSEGSNIDLAEVNLVNHPRGVHSQEPAMRKAWTVNGKKLKSNLILMGESLTVFFEFRCSRPVINPGFGFVIEDGHGRPVFCLNNYIVPTDNNTFRSTKAGVASLHIPHVPLLPGTYFINLAIMEGGSQKCVDFVGEALAFHVHAADVYGFGKIPDNTVGIVFVPGQITVSPENGTVGECHDS
jgi:lipopolysaccharide transport system ATP-binding protein